MSFEDFMLTLTQTERLTMGRLTSPSLIQSFFDETHYSADPFYRSPQRVLRERIAHCFDGALFAAAALRRIGYPPLILEMLPNDRDDDHLLAVFKRDEHWGAVAKSNFIGLRFREPVYRTLRELMMSYFEQFYNVEREKTLRGYTLPLNLNAFDKSGWMISDEPLEAIARRLDEIRRFELLTPDMIENLSLLDDRASKAGLVGMNEAGLYRPGKNSGH
jgi:hypothetical protein